MGKSDEELLEDYLNGTTAALGTLVERYRPMLYGFILSMTDSHADADEVFQDAWLKVIRNARAYRRRNLRGWLFRISHNVVIDMMRRRRRIVSLDGQTGDGRPVNLTETVRAREDSPAETAQQRELGRRIEAAVRALPPEQKEVFLLRMQGDLPFKEIARLQRVSINTALARMHYAVKRLRGLLREDYDRLGEEQ